MTHEDYWMSNVCGWLRNIERKKQFFMIVLIINDVKDFLSFLFINTFT
jgi:hypothetical protein